MNQTFRGSSGTYTTFATRGGEQLAVNLSGIIPGSSNGGFKYFIVARFLVWSDTGDYGIFTTFTPRGISRYLKAGDTKYRRAVQLDKTEFTLFESKTNTSGQNILMNLVENVSVIPAIVSWLGGLATAEGFTEGFSEENTAQIIRTALGLDLLLPMEAIEFEPEFPTLTGNPEKAATVLAMLKQEEIPYQASKSAFVLAWDDEEEEEEEDDDEVDADEDNPDTEDLDEEAE